MLVFSKNNLLVKHETFDFDEEYIKSHAGLRISRLSSDLPENWHALTQWADVEADSLREGEEFIGLRELWHIAGSQAFAQTGGALMFAEWFRNFRMCPACGGDLEANSHDFGRKCSECGKVYYVQQSPAIIVAVRREDSLLLAHNSVQHHRGIR